MRCVQGLPGKQEAVAGPLSHFVAGEVDMPRHRWHLHDQSNEHNLEYLNLLSNSVCPARLLGPGPRHERRVGTAPRGLEAYGVCTVAIALCVWSSV